MTSVMVTGALCHAPLRNAVVVGGDAVAARLDEQALSGVLLGNLGAEALDRLRHYAIATGARWQDCPCETSAGRADAVIFDDHADMTAEGVALAEDIMALKGVVPPEALARRLGSLRVAAASRVRAAKTASRNLRVGAGEVQVLGRKVQHGGFFALESLSLAYRRFDGQMSRPLLREVFVAGDAVTVLPYDPVRDRVLLIEQMRVGPLGRGDPLPWQLEAIAGRIDPGETAQDCARREAEEEAGLVLGGLEMVGEYYPTPGAVTEYLYSYVALCDLPDGAAGVFGVADEAEDIRGHLVGFDVLMELVASGEVANAPLLLTALWLQRERARLRG